jgi:hypothetical protein
MSLHLLFGVARGGEGFEEAGKGKIALTSNI